MGTDAKVSLAAPAPFDYLYTSNQSPAIVALSLAHVYCMHVCRVIKIRSCRRWVETWAKCATGNWPVHYYVIGVNVLGKV